MDPFIDFLKCQNAQHARTISEMLGGYIADSQKNILHWDGYVPPCEYPDDLETIDDNKCVNVDPGQVILEKEVDDGL